MIAAVSTSAPGARPLAGIRVLDLSRLIPGPWCSQMLADLGADVIKVETPLAGDYARIAPPELGFGGVFEAVNRGKRSIAVNYRLPRGRAVILRLAATADVFLESSMPGQLARRGLGPVDVRAANPRLVYCSLSGYGQAGPYRDRPGHDLDYLAISGLLALLGPAGTRPVPPGLQIADLAGGTLAALEIVAALLRRERTGEGATLDVAILDAVVAWLAPLGPGVATAGAAPGALSGAFPCYGVYAAGDGAFLAVGALEPPFWVAFCRAVGREDLVPRQYDPTAVPVVAGILALRPRAAWLETLADHACVAPVNAPGEAELDPQVLARGLVVGEGTAAHVRSPLGSVATGAAGPGQRAVAAPEPVAAPEATPEPAFDAAPDADPEAIPEPPAPGLGEHTREVLAAAGVEADELAALERDGIVAGPASPEATARAARLASVLARLAERGGGDERS